MPWPMIATELEICQNRGWMDGWVWVGEWYLSKQKGLKKVCHIVERPNNSAKGGFRTLTIEFSFLRHGVVTCVVTLMTFLHFVFRFE